MGFDTGPISFRRFLVVGTAPAAPEQALLDKLSEHAIRPSEMGVPDELEYGWNGGRHVLDGQFEFDTNVFADAMHFALRVDVNRVPAELKRAYQIMEEDAAAAGNPSQLVSKKQKRDAREVARRKVDDELRSGQYRRSRIRNVLWDVPAGMLYCNASGRTESQLCELFQRTFDLELRSLSAGGMATRHVEASGRRRDVEDLRPTRFVTGPDRIDGDIDAPVDAIPDYPWTTKSAESKDFLGNEFLLWLWFEADRNDGFVNLTDAPAGVARVDLFFDRVLDLDCAFGSSGKTALRAGATTRMAEAPVGLRSGKVPRKIGMTLGVGGDVFNLTLAAESMAIAGLKLPEVPEAETPRVLFEERVGQLRDLSRAIDALFASFLKARLGGAWDTTATSMRRWIAELGKPRKPVVRRTVEVELATVEG